MRETGTCVKRTRKYTTEADSNHSFNIASNLLNRGFSPKRSNQKWAADISFVWTQESWLYLAVILDLHSGRAVGWAASNRMSGKWMSGKGNCYDNAAVDTFFRSIKAGLIWRRPWPTRRHAELAVFEYVNGFYYPRGKHSALGWKRSDPRTKLAEPPVGMAEAQEMNANLDDYAVQKTCCGTALSPRAMDQRLMCVEQLERSIYARLQLERSNNGGCR